MNDDYLSTQAMRTMTYRHLKQQILSLVQAEDFQSSLQALGQLPPRKAVNPLFGLFHHRLALVRWRAVTAMGEVVAGLAAQDLEAARIIMRRLMWNLNDESGGIGWGSPEAMGEIMARHRRLAEEYASILISYLNPRGNFLEHEGLQKGLLWALGRLAGAHPDLAAQARPYLPPFLFSREPALRGLAIWSGGQLPDPGDRFRQGVQRCRRDHTQVAIYQDGCLETVSIDHLAETVLTA